MARKLVLTSLFIFSVFLVTPSPALANLQTLNGQFGKTQSFVNDSNLSISSSSNLHTILWQGVLPISRGGTGTSSFTEGSIPFIENGVFSENSRLRWNNSEGDSKLILGDNTESPAELVLAQGSLLRLRNVDPLGSQEIIFEDHRGTSSGVSGLFHISYEAEPFDSLMMTSYLQDAGIGIDRKSGNVIIGKHFTTELFPPKGTLQVQDSTDAFDHRSTLYIGGAEFGSFPQPTSTGCLVMGDSDGTGITYITANDGVLTSSATKPSVCQ